MAYESTSVAVDKSQGDIRRILREHGADQFQFGEAEIDGRRWAGLEFATEGTRIRIRVPMNEPDEKWVKTKLQRARSKTREDFVVEHYEQEEKRIWRVLYWSIKARMEAVTEGVEEFEQAWMAHIVDPFTGDTVWDQLAPHIQAGALRVGGSGLKALEAHVG